MLSVSLDDVTENWSEVSRKGETFELFLSFIFLRGGGEGLVKRVRHNHGNEVWLSYELFLKELEIGNYACNFHLNLSHFANF